MVSKRLLVLIECAIFAAIAMVLSFIPLDFGSSFSISLGMIPMYVIALRRGFFAAGFAGILWGLLHFLTGKAYILTWNQALIEYILAFAFVAFAGIFAKNVQAALKQKKYEASSVLCLEFHVYWRHSSLFLALCCWGCFFGALMHLRVGALNSFHLL